MTSDVEERRVETEASLPHDVIDAEEIFDADLPVVVVKAKKREQGVLILGDRRYRVTRPKRIASLTLAEGINEVDELMLSTRKEDREKAARMIRQWVTLVFSRVGHPGEALECQKCDACAVIRHLQSDAPEDMDDISDAVNELAEAWGIVPPRDVRRAAARKQKAAGTRGANKR